MTRFAPTRWTPWTRWSIAGSLVVLLLLSSGFGSPGSAAMPRPGPAAGTPGPGTVSITGSVLYDGQPTANATGPSSALPIGFDHVSTVQFSWQAAGGKIGQPLSIAIQTARLEVFFLGLSVYTKDQTLSPPSVAARGTVNLSADFTLNRYLLEGLYKFAGTLIAPNGTTVWSEQFFVKVTAPNQLTAANIGLALVAVYELYTILTVGRWITGQTRKPKETKDSPTAGGPDSTPPGPGAGGP